MSRNIRFLSLALLLAPHWAAAQASPRGLIRHFARDRPISFEEGSHFFPLAPEPGVVGWEIRLEIENPRKVDVDLAVHASGPQASSNDSPLCMSEGVGAEERCSFVFPGPSRGGGDTLWVEVYAADGDGETEYSLTGTPRRGPRMEGTSLTASEAASLGTGSRRALFSYSRQTQENSFAHLYEVVRRDRQGDSTYVNVVSGNPSIPLTIDVFDARGSRVAADSLKPYHTLPLSASGDRSYVMVQLSDPKQVLNLPSYQIAVGSASLPIPIGLGAEPVTIEGRGTRNYRVHVPQGKAAVITLEGEHDSLTVSYPGGRQVPTQRTYTGLMSFARVGAPSSESRHLLDALPDSSLMDIRVVSRGAGLHADSSWQLMIHPSRLGRTAQIVDFPSGAWERWIESWQPVNRPEIRVNVPPGGMRTFWLPAPPSGGEGLQFGARIVEPRSSRFDIAVSDEYGQVVALGHDVATWKWPAGVSNLYLHVLRHAGSTPLDNRSQEVLLQVISPYQTPVKR